MYLTDMFIMIIRHQTYGQEKYWLPANNEFLYFHLFYLYYISTKYQIICNFIKAEGYDILYKNKHVPTLDVLIPHYKAQYCDSKQRIHVLTLDVSIPHYKPHYCASKQRIHVPTLGISIPHYKAQYCDSKQRIHVPTLGISIPHYKAQYCDSKQRIHVPTLGISIPHYKPQYCASKQRIHVLTLGISVPDFNTAVSRCCNNQWLIRIWQKQAGFHSLRVTFELMQKVS